MKLSWLKLPRYRNLINFEIRFDSKQSTTILLGKNGTGKSNLLEALVEIFSNLELESPPTFAYELQYICRDLTIGLSADPKRSTGRLSVSVNGDPLPLGEFNRTRAKYLPNYVFAYYSGWNGRLEGHFRNGTVKYYREVLASPDRQLPLRRLFFCRREYSQLVLLAFFLDTSQKSRALLKKYLSIEGFDSALFVFQRPDWGKDRSRDGDPRFWHARGAFRGFLGDLWDQALAPLRRVETIERDVWRQGERIEHMYLFIKDQRTLETLAGATERNPTQFFGYLESTFLCGLIDEVRVTVRKIDGTRVKFSQLSEGEQQLLTVLGLLLFTQNDEALYLLDEPDTHLNPIWTYEYLSLLHENMRADKGQLIIATHNPLMIGSVYKDQVRVLSTEDDAVAAREPDYDPIGIGVEGLLKSELYGLRSTLPAEILAKLDRHYELLGKERKSPEEQIELITISNELNELRIARTHPNPYFDQFANAMAKITPAPSTIMNKAQLDEQTVLADKLLQEIISVDGTSRT